MKKYISAIALSALVCSSCSDFLDVQPEGNATTDTYFTNDSQVLDAVDGLYGRFAQEDAFGRNIYAEQMAANDFAWGRETGWSTLGTFSQSGDESCLTGPFERMYLVMARSNWVIKNLLKKSSLTDIEKRSLGEAYFTRAWAHFVIAYRYGTEDQGVPFVRWEDFEGEYDNSIPPQQASVIDNYKYIIEDMDMALQNLPRFEEYGPDDQGRAHQAAAVAFKAKTYAYWATWDDSQWPNVIEQVNLLENTYGCDLAPTFEILFTDNVADFWSHKEHIWSLPSNGGELCGGVELPGCMLENKGWGLFNGWGQMKPTLDIYEEMLKDGEGNIRLRKSILEYGQEFVYFGKTWRFYSASDIETGFQVNKYMDAWRYEDPWGEDAVGTADWPIARMNFPIIRFAEMLLFRAEAYLHAGQADKAADDINRIRKRCELTPLSGNATWTDLYHERRCELAFELASDHLYDLKRWNYSGAVEIQAIATAELNARPRVRHYVNRSDPDSEYTIGYYEDYTNKRTYEQYMMVHPYPSAQITKSGGALKQNPGW